MAQGSWSSDGLIETTREDKGTYWLVTVRDNLPINSSPRRFVRLLQIVRP